MSAWWLRRAQPRHRAVRRGLRRRLALPLFLLLVATGLSVAPPAAEAAVRAPFNKVYGTQDNGAISIIGNSQMTCSTAVSGCVAARSGSGSNVNNNNYAMEMLDTDADASTSNSTSADLAMPAGSTVLYARLIWGARLAAGASGAAPVVASPNAALLRAPGQSAYSAVTATTVTRPFTPTGSDADPYQSAIDVTSTVRTGGNGTYSFANMAAATGTDRYAGWSLIVAYRNPSLPLRDLSVFQGFADVTTSTGNSSVSATVSGILTPAVGTVNATVGLLAWEGDLGSTGDQLSLNGTHLNDAQRADNNSFDSRISNVGVNVTNRNPSPINNFGIDMGRVSANGVLGNAQTTATVGVSTTSETVYLAAMTTEIDLYTPSFAGLTKSVVDLNGNSPAKVGDTLEYRLAFTNSGQDYADNTAVRDPLPANVTYVPGSLAVTAGANTGPVTDAADADVGEYVAGSRQVQVRLGTGANGTTGGTISVGDSSTSAFRVTVDRAAAGSTVINGAFLDYTARTLARSYTFVSNTVSTPVQPIADLGITDTATPTSQNAGGQVTYSLGVTNNGPAASTNVVTTDTLATGTSYSSSNPPAGTSCSAAGQVVTCLTPSLPAGTLLTIPIVADIAPGLAVGSLVNVAGVTSDTTDDVSSNNSATATTTTTRSADLSLANAGPVTVVAGATLTYTLTLANGGPSSATGASVADTLPVGVTLVSATPSQGTCTTDTQSATCALGTVAPNDSATVQVVGRVAASFTGTQIVSSATATSTVPDPSSANNAAQATSAVTRVADLSVTQAATPATVSAGNTVDLLVTAANAGQSDANGTHVTESLPAGLSVVSVNPTQGSCTSTATSLDCDLGLLTPGTSARVAVQARVAPDTAAGSVSATAAGTTSTPETVTANNQGPATFTVASVADLSLSETAGPDPVQPGNQLTYTLVASNAGPSVAHGVSLVDTLAAGTSFVAAGSSPGCTASGGTVTCTVGTIDPGATVQRVVVISTPGTIPGGTLTDSAVVTSPDDPDTTNNRASFSSSLDPHADLSLTAGTGPAPLVAGGPVTYTLAAVNNGPSTATSVQVVDTLPAELTFASASTTGGGTCVRAGQQVTCTYPSLNGGDSPTVTITGTLDPDTATGPSTNSATIGAADANDPTQSNNTDTSTVDVTRDADLAVVMTALTPSVAAGEVATYRMSLSNNGPSSAVNAVVTGQVPAGLAPVTGSSGGACTLTGRTVSCPVALLAPGASTSPTFQALVIPSTPAGTPTGTAYAGSDTPDSDASDNSDTAAISVTTSADLQAASSVQPTELTPGGTAVYTLSATNAGPSDATTVTLTDTVPAGLAITTVDPSAGTCTITGQQVVCLVDRLAAAAVLTVRIGVTVSPGLTGSVTNAVTVASDIADPTPGDDTASTTSTLAPRADLQLTATADAAVTVAGTSVTYTLTAVNTGPSAAVGVILGDTLPADLQLQPGGVDAPAGVTCTVAGQDISCALGTMAPGDTATVTVSAFVPGDLPAGRQLTDTGSLTSTTPTDTPADRTADVTTVVDTSADLEVTKTAQNGSPVAGDTATYLLTVVNHGPSVARAAQVADTLPSNLTYRSATDPAGDCTDADAAVTCSLGDLAVGETVVVTVVADIDPAAAGDQVTDTAQVSSTTSDPDGADDSDSVTQTVGAQNDLDITSQVTSGPVVAGQDATYRIRVTNNGPSQARQVTVLDQIPDLLGYVSAVAADGGGCVYETLAQTPADDDRIRCTWDTLAVGDSTYVDLVVSVPATYPPGQQITNTATAASSAVDPTPATTTLVTPVGDSGDLRATKTLLSGPPIAGEEIRWQVEVDNSGPSTSRDVTLSDPNPTGVTLDDAQTQTGSCAVDADGATCDLGDLAVDGSVVVTLSGIVADGYTGATLDNTATVDSATDDPRPGDDTASISTPVSGASDLRVATAATTATATAGADTTWTVTVTNNGPSVATQVVIDDALPEGVTGVSPSLAGAGTCTALPQVRCVVPSIAVGRSAVVTVVGTLDPSYPGTTVITTADATSAVADPDPLDNSATSTTPVARSADLALVQDGPTQVQAGDPVTWTLTVSNSGPSDATGAVVTDELPADVSGATGSFPGGSCSLASGALTCPIGLVPSGRSVLITVTATVDPDTTAATLVSSSSVAASTSDPQAGDDTATTTTDVLRAAGVSVTNAATTGMVAGDPASWLVTVANAGPSTALDVTLTDVVDAAVGQLGTDTPGCTVSGQTVSCAVATLAPGASLQVTVRGVLATGFTGATVATTADVASSTADPDPSDNEATSTSDATRSADLGLTKAVTSGDPVAGAAITYDLEVSNRGPSTARGVQVTDPVPGRVSQVTATSPDGTCAVSAEGVVSCDLADVPDGGTATVSVDGVLGQDVSSTLANTASVAAATPDPDDSANTATAESSVDASADIGVTQTGPATVVAGGGASWTLVVANHGPSVARSVVLADALPAGVGDVSVDAPAGVTCTTEVSCTVGDLGPGEEVTVTVTVAVDPAAEGATLTNRATVDSTTADPSSVNQESVSEAIVGGVADLSVTTTSSPSTLTPGTDSTYTVTVSNAGPSTARAVQVTDSLPEGMTLRAAGPTADRGVCVVTGRAVTCTVATLASGASVGFDLPVSLDSSFTAGQLLDTAHVSSATSDPDATDDTASLPSVVAARADLTVTKTGPAQVDAGAPVAWTLQVSNDGPSDAQDVVVSDPLPAGVGQVYVTSDQGTCSQVGTTVQCVLGTVTAHAVVNIRVGTVGDLSPSFPAGALTTTATVTSSTVDLGSGDTGAGNGRTATSTTQVDVSADVSVFKSPISSTALAGGSVGWAIVVVNQGPSTAQDVVLTDPDVPGVHNTTITPPAGVTCDGDSCDIRTLLPGNGHALLFVALGTLAPDYTDDTVVDTATVTTSSPDPDDGDNRAASPVVVGRAAGVSIVKTPSSPSATPGQPVAWTIRVHNGGPSVATGVVVHDTVPGEVGDVVVTPPAGVTCSGTASLTCTADSLASGANADITVTGVLGLGSQAGTLSNTASVTSDSPDPDTADNSSTSTQQVTAGADLSITKVADVASAVAGRRVTWTIRVTNTGPSPAHDVIVTDPVPSGVALVATPGCTPRGGVAVCRLGELAPEATRGVTVEGQVAPDLVGNLVNTATVASSTTDPDPDDDTATSAIPVRVVADLVVRQTARTDRPARIGSVVRYRTTVTNRGPSDVSGVALTDTWPGALRLVWALPGQGMFDARTHVWAVDRLTAGTGAELRLLTTAHDAGQVVNTIELTGPAVATDPDAVNNRATTTVRVVAGPGPQPHGGSDGSPGVSPAGGSPPGASPTGPSAGGLPNTGGPALWIGVGGLSLVLAGLGLVLYDRRRRRLSL